ncbi:AfsR/SARP family transcriptional regulator [Nonomuraea sp. CA-141351]|uniref:AfsR/SARP family transcriptional regulator n=1 Tax=Nonomuraea sp. CA-141351 TaxID=3239996 RepID=UPI003D92FD8E
MRRLLGALLLTPGRLVDRARLIAFVWGLAGCEPAALHSAVYRPREWLNPTGIQIVREGDGYRIEVPPEQVDASRFRIAVAGASRAGSLSRSEIRFRTVSWDFAARSERLLRPSQGVVIACPPVGEGPVRPAGGTGPR